MAMARIAVADGVRDLAATPHVSYEFPNDAKRILTVIEEFRRRLSDAGIALRVHQGADYHLTPELLRSNDLMTLGEGGVYFLLEFPSMVVPPNILSILEKFVERGRVPVITHPERNLHLTRRPELLRRMAAIGCPVQITAGSLTGAFGEDVARGARGLLERGLVHLVASDAHGRTDRSPVLSEGFRVARGVVGEQPALDMVGANAKKVLQGLALPTIPNV
jgi:protein-tyrosine phosphatase